MLTIAMQTGLDRLGSDDAVARLVRGARVGLVAHPASVDRGMTHARAVLDRVGASPRIVFGPEHGYGGEAQDMVGVADARDRRGTPVRSLYGERFEDLSPRDDDVRDLDVIVVDLQDVGARYYTFVWTALLALRVASRLGVRTLVLDRPNPIGADPSTIEGRLPEARCLSFVGLEPVPIRHALTLGEILAHRAREERLAGLDVVASRGLPLEADARAWGRPFVPPSPNMPTFDTALVYPGACLLEGTNLSEGRGTTRPFEVFGAPWLDGERLAVDFARDSLPGVVARPITFLPTFHKHARQACGGVHVHVTEPRAFRPVEAYLTLIALARAQAPERFAFRTERYEFVDDVPAFDLLMGSAGAREAMLAGAAPQDLRAAFARPTTAELSLAAEARAHAARHARRRRR
jgi:uncharacterized protein YbbC (DUF1343 family)